jgi:serine/threonine-protein kinase RsbW
MAENSSGGTTSVVSILASTLESVDAAEEIVLTAAQQMGFDEDVRFQIGLAVRESMVNAVVHGNCYSEKKKVRLAVSRGPDRLTVIVTDEGKGFDIDSVPDPLAQEHLLDQSGRGILLIRSFMDEFEVRQLEPRGTEFKLVKYLHQTK